MTNCYNLNLNIDPLINKEDFLIRNLPYHYQIPLEDINPDLKERLLNLGLYLFLAEMFHTRPKQPTVIHTDLSLGDYTKINYVFGGKNSVMNWYEPKNSISKSLQTTVIGTPYTSYEEDEVQLIQQSIIGFPSLVQVGVPHNVQNNEEHRFCLSLAYKETENDQRPTMKRSLEIFQDLIES